MAGLYYLSFLHQLWLHGTITSLLSSGLALIPEAFTATSRYRIRVHLPEVYLQHRHVQLHKSQVSMAFTVSTRVSHCFYLLEWARLPD